MEVVLLLPWRHVFGQLLSESTLASLLHWVFVLEPCLHLVILVIILLVLFENFWVLSQILFVRNPRSINAILVMVYVLQVEVHC